MSVSEKIDEIIAKRKVGVGKVREALAKAEKCFNAVQSLERFKNEHGEDNETLFAIRSISTDAFQRRYREYTAALQSLQNRFQRNSIHISFVGKAGQGKSTVMQKISGLGRDIIPASDGADCTGAKSIISNSAESEIVAEITFFSETELIHNVNEYLKTIYSGKVPLVGSINDIAHLRLPALGSDASAEHIEQFQHLKKYVEHIADYRENLGKKKIVPENEIEEYVAQYNHADSGKKYYKYLGVKIANICCNFPHKDCGKIVLVDTIGIGATSLGVEEEMMDTIKNDSDAVVFMFRPERLRPKISDEEPKIIDNISNALPEGVAKKSVYGVVNQQADGGDNYKKTVGVISEQMRKWSVADVFLLNCSDDGEVSEKLLAPLLASISQNIEDVDRLLLQGLADKAAALREEYDAICAKIIAPEIKNSLVGKADADAIETKLEAIYKTFFYGQGSNSLKNYCSHLWNQRDAECEEFTAALKTKVNTVFTAIPSKERIVTMLTTGEAGSPVDAMLISMDRTRTELIVRFLQLDETLAKIVEATKRHLAEMLSEYAKFGNIVPLENADSATAWFGMLVEKIDADKYPCLYEALQGIKDFEISMRGILVYAIRDALSGIDHTITGKVPAVGPMGDSERTAERIRAILEREMTDIQAKIRQGTKDLPKVPNRALYAVVRDLQEKLQYSAKDNYHTTEREFRGFYRQFQSVILKDEYDKILKSQAFYQSWEKVVDVLNHCNLG